MYTTEADGKINNFAREPKMYYASYPSTVEQRRYLWQGIAALAFVSVLILTSVAVS